MLSIYIYMYIHMLYNNVNVHTCVYIYFYTWWHIYLQMHILHVYMDTVKSRCLFGLRPWGSSDARSPNGGREDPAVKRYTQNKGSVERGAFLYFSLT